MSYESWVAVHLMATHRGVCVGVEGLGCGVEGGGFRVEDLGCGVEGLGFRVWGVGLRV